MCSLRLDKSLSLHENILTRSRAQNLIDDQRVRVNGKIVKPSHTVQISDQIEIDFPEVKTSEIKPLDLKLDILFEDKDIIVLNKPAGLVVHPAAGHEQDTLVNALVHHTQDLSMKYGEVRPGIVHRLDKETSGIMVVAKNDKAHEHLAQQFKDRSIHRIYFAACFGVPKEKSGKIQSYLGRHPTDRKKFSSLKEAHQIIREPMNPEDSERFHVKWAVTNYECLTTYKHQLSYFRLKLETGRTHQIRVHLSEMGHPILADSTYGSDHKVKNLPQAELRNKIKALPRFALHAAELGLIHPTTQEKLFFTAPWPDDLSPLLKEFEFIKSE